MKLLFVHGWGFDAGFWRLLAAQLREWEQVIEDRGYFGAPTGPGALVEGPCIAVTHSLGTMRLLAAPPPGLAGLVAINGFARFTARPDKAGVPVRVVDRMIRRFAQSPASVLADFRRTCGCPEGKQGAEPDTLDTALLQADLLRLRNGDSPPCPVPLLAIHGGRDPLLPPAMREEAFSREDAQHIDVPEGGHLLPLEDPALCAQAVRGMIGTLAR